MSENSRQISIQLSGVKKMYKLGQISGGTLQGDLQSWWARVRGKEDPNIKIGHNQRLVGQTFMALNGIDLTVYQGEALGIIGANGAGKSTMLKLLSKVTAPTEGEIDIYGRIASMLEVGTGFNGEMTGRENVYMNGAILGMTKAEIDAKMEDIIEFSEVREFIDTPVKRYSSGMYVKLAFSVAAHLDSEIMIMDEVLAVGDMAFQKKCLSKMREAANKEGRTVLYVSHNMNTIRQLCDRCIVLDQGKIVFDGDVEEAIDVYANSKNNDSVYVDYSQKKEPSWLHDPKIKLLSVEFIGKDSNVFDSNEPLIMKFKWLTKKPVNDVCLRIEVLSMDESPVGAYLVFDIFTSQSDKKYEMTLELNTQFLARSKYQMKFVFFEKDEYGNNVNIGFGRDMFFEISSLNDEKQLVWDTRQWGYTVQPNHKIVSFQSNENTGCINPI